MYKKIMLIVSSFVISIAFAERVQISKSGDLGSLPFEKPATYVADNYNRTILLSEDFTNTTFPPTGWTRISMNVADSTWHRRTQHYHSSPASAFCWWSWMRQNEWLISPPITLTGSSGGVYYLKWWYYGYRGSTYGDHYYTKIIVGNDTTVLYDLSTQTGGWNEFATPVEVSLNAYAGQTVKIAFHAFDGYPTNTGLWYAWGIDDVEIGYPVDNDVGVDAILSPGAFHTPNTIMTPQALVKNYGSANQTNFQVVCSIVGPGGVFRYYSSKTVASLAAGATTTVVFDTWRPVVQEQLTVMMKTMLVGDQDPTNDRKTRTCIVSNITQIIIGTGTTTSYQNPINRFYNYSATEAIYLQSEIGTAGTIMNIGYYKGSGTDLNPIDSVYIYLKHTTATSLATGTFSFDGYTLVYSGQYPNHLPEGWLEVDLQTPFDYNNTDNLQILVVKYYQQYIGTTAAPNWRYTSTSPTYLSRIYYSDYNRPAPNSSSLSATYNRPNIRLTLSPQAPPANDVGVMRIIAPVGSYQVGTPITPRAVVKNYGTANQTNFPVICSIIGPAKVVRYVNTQTISLAAGDTMVVNFGTYNANIAEYESVFVRTALAGDERPNNDRKSRGFLIHSYMLLEGFNDVTFPPPGWQANIINGTYNWERFTQGTSPTCSPYEGEAMAGYRSYSATSGSMARLISPPVNCGTTPQPINVIFNMYHDPAYPGGTYGPDSIKVEYSTDGVNFTQVASFRRYEPTAGWQEHTVNLGTFSGTLYVGFLAFSEYGNNMFIDFVRMAPGGIEEQKPGRLPLVTALNTIKPNPVVNGLAQISFAIAEPSRVSLKIYDASGRIIKTLVNSDLNSGVYELTWNGTDENNQKVADGIYFYTLTAGTKRFTKKMIYTQ